MVVRYLLNVFVSSLLGRFKFVGLKAHVNSFHLFLKTQICNCYNLPKNKNNNNNMKESVIQLGNIKSFRNERIFYFLTQIIQ